LEYRYLHYELTRIAACARERSLEKKATFMPPPEIPEPATTH